MEKSGDLFGPAGIFGDLSGPASIFGHLWDLWGSAGICGDLSETLCNLVVGPGFFPRPTAISPGQNSLPSWSYPQDGRTAPLQTLLEKGEAIEEVKGEVGRGKLG